MDNFDLRKYISEGRIFEDEIDQLADELADEIKDTLEAEPIKEGPGTVAIISTILASTTALNILSKYAGKIFKKYNFGTGEAAAKRIYDFTHTVESRFKGPIKTVVKFFTKDERMINTVTNSLYALLILTLASIAGGGALSKALVGDSVGSSISALKVALKGKDLSTLAKDIASNAPV